MGNILIAALAWFALAVHLAVGVATWRRVSALPLLPLLNLAVAVGVLGYWIPRWYSYVFRGIQWYATDQIVPLYALLVCALAMSSLTGRPLSNVPHWIVFAIDTIVLIGAVAFFALFKINRLF
ncbi:MAG: hypothetical protein ABI625_00810 [bacterium]